jgi:hypothetical protein
LLRKKYFLFYNMIINNSEALKSSLAIDEVIGLMQKYPPIFLKIFYNHLTV